MHEEEFLWVISHEKGERDGIEDRESETDKLDQLCETLRVDIPEPIRCL